ncbi:MAG: hypothetical protein AAF984_03030 [Verrucomicrobiota bacterium]
MTESEKLNLRIETLLQKLEVKASQAPGLYPVKKREEFLKIAVAVMSKFMALDLKMNLQYKDYPLSVKEHLANWLEDIFRQPEGAYQLNAQSLIGEGKGFSA